MLDSRNITFLNKRAVDRLAYRSNDMGASASMGEKGRRRQEVLVTT